MAKNDKTLLNNFQMSYAELFVKIKQVLFTHFQNKIKQELHEDIVWCVRIREHSSGFRNVKNSTSNFPQIVQICCREKYQYKNNENFKAFCIIRKRQQSTSSNNLLVVYCFPE